MLTNLNVFDMFPSIESAGRRFASLHRVLRGEFPCFNGTIKALRLPAAHPAALRFLRLAVPRFHSLRSLPGRRVGRRGLELVTRYLQPGVAEETTGSPKFLGNPDCPFAHVQSTPAGLLAPDHYDAAAWPLVCEKQRLPRKVFRRSIAWLSDSLSTLRRTGHPATTQDSLPAAGQALPDGLSTRKVPTKGFRSASLHRIPLSQALLGTMKSTAAPKRDPTAVVNIVPSKAWERGMRCK
jgi:hypothetical protein